MRALALDVRRRNDLGRQVEPLAEIIKTLSRKGVVVVLPREARLEVAARRERLAGVDYEKVLCLDIRVVALEVLGGNELGLGESRSVDAGK